MNKKAAVTLGSVSTFLIALILTGTFFFYQFLKTGVSSDTTEVLFDVEPGQTIATVSENLEQQKLIKNKWLFFQYARYVGANARLKKGEYSLNQSMNPDQIIAVITSGRSVARNFTVIEGANIFDIADQVEKSGIGTRDEFLKLVRDQDYITTTLNLRKGVDLIPESLEGYLYPETYKYTKFDSVKELTTQMVKKFLKVWEEFEPMAKKINWSRHKVVTFASIVEKETGHAEDRPLVSSVFHNRLIKKMKLQTDPTILYGIAVETGVMPKNISKKDILTPTRYNTYTIPGLPPTPISNPGRDAYFVALNPVKTNYLYFVSKNDGTTAFSESYQSHSKAVQSYQINSKAREGKSWRDLKKKSN